MLLASYPTGAFDGDGGARYDALGVLAVENGKFVPNANLRSVSTSSAGCGDPPVHLGAEATSTIGGFRGMGFVRGC
jgi:hypothetical protein